MVCSLPAKPSLGMGVDSIVSAVTLAVNPKKHGSVCTSIQTSNGANDKYEQADCKHPCAWAFLKVGPTMMRFACV